MRFRQVSLRCPEPAPKSVRGPGSDRPPQRFLITVSHGSGGMAQTFSEGFGLQAGRCSLQAEVPGAFASRERQDITSRLAKGRDGSVVPRTPAMLQLEPTGFLSEHLKAWARADQGEGAKG